MHTLLRIGPNVLHVHGLPTACMRACPLMITHVGLSEDLVVCVGSRYLGQLLGHLKSCEKMV